MIYNDYNALKDGISGTLAIEGGDVTVLDKETLRGGLIDDLIFTAVFSPDSETKEAARWLIRRAGAALGIIASSIQSFYDAMGKKELTGFTVPAINLRGITYYSAQAVFRAALAGNVGPIIFEIARSEIGYTDQRPAEYTTAVTAAAIKTGFKGPLFMQGDHFQINAKKYAGDPARETEAIKTLIREAIEGGFYNIDIDASTVVDLSKPTIKEQQEGNYSITADFTALIREIEPAGITISVGGEIGEVGTKNTTVEEFEIFMEGYLEELRKKGKNLKGISKISIQTGTSHGGVPLPDGSIAKVKIDFDTLEMISETAKSGFGLSGAVQHGASTLPDEAFDKFPKTGTAEIHLATGFQNIIYDSANFPEEVKNTIYDYINAELRGEKKEADTEEQFIYKTRKKGFGPFKEALWNLPPEILDKIGAELERKFAFLFDKLNVRKTKDLVDKYVKPVDVPLALPEILSK
ncbi:MAG: class II fructose-bisphosphate aldolase [Deltaproteobacteria bacterium]|nr:class II fructose-bisphosphate aldolase [Deltaproteobacteria bacterium]MBN2846744.1 class II fructose-bisphosphate aldolase [Deltaproteobacteria bacterium]